MRGWDPTLIACRRRRSVVQGTRKSERNQICRGSGSGTHRVRGRPYIGNGLLSRQWERSSVDRIWSECGGPPPRRDYCGGEQPRDFKFPAAAADSLRYRCRCFPSVAAASRFNPGNLGSAHRVTGARRLLNPLARPPTRPPFCVNCAARLRLRRRGISFLVPSFLLRTVAIYMGCVERSQL